MTTSEILFGTKLCPVNQEELARLVGVDPSTISRWKRNPGAIPWNKFKILVRIRKLTGDDIIKMSRER